MSRVGWMMGDYFAKSLKRQYAYANSPTIRKLDKNQDQPAGRSRVVTSRQCGLGKVKTTTVYKDSKGKKRYQGSSELKGTETLDLQ